MERQLIIEVPGKPIAQRRPNFFRRGKRVGTYNPQESEAGKFIVQCLEQIKSVEGLPIPKDVPIRLECAFCFAIPKSMPRKRLLELNLQHITRPDIDNCLKWVLDCLGKGVVYRDDSQICIIKAVKLLADNPMTRIKVSWGDGSK